MDHEMAKKLWHIEDALTARDKVECAVYRTGDAQGKNRTIINISHDEALAIEQALNYYIEKFEDAYGRKE